MLSRAQAKKNVGGAEPELGICAVTTSCRIYVHELHQTLNGECFYQIGGKCYCASGVYYTNPSTTSMCYIEF